MDKDKQAMDWIDKELDRINKQYLPLCKRLEERERKMQSVKANLELAESTMFQIMGQTKKTAFSGMISNAKMLKSTASSHIKHLRGFGVEPETTFYQSRAIGNNKK
jgi:hypothetical protein